ncbi:MAG: 50S ribosomal protein L31 [Gemmatimonadetes bacterium]|nr:50S ribosomal protein L31 [Gemmatimonadota bacterium]
MKTGIHPKYMEAKVSCGCGVSFTTMATVPEIRLDICSACHPFYTGKQRLVDTAGRIDRFHKRYAGAGGG